MGRKRDHIIHGMWKVQIVALGFGAWMRIKAVNERQQQQQQEEEEERRGGGKGRREGEEEESVNHCVHHTGGVRIKMSHIVCEKIIHIEVGAPE